MSRLKRKDRIIRKDDDVLVIAGEFKGREGKVLAVNRKTERVTVEGVNKVLKNLRKSQEHPAGARIQREAPMHLSNVRKIIRVKAEEDSGEE